MKKVIYIIAGFVALVVGMNTAHAITISPDPKLEVKTIFNPRPVIPQVR